MEHSLHDVAAIRRDYKRASLSEDSVANNPMEQFTRWFNEALTAEVVEANAMTLATATPDGKPSARIVLLKGIDERGFIFFTNYESRKGHELAENPHVHIVFFWHELERQVRIDGIAEKVSEQESYEYFQSRPAESRIGAWASHQSSIIENRAVLEKKFGELKQQYQNQEIPLPPFWGGYRIIPSQIEFWQGRPNRLHDRIMYGLQDHEWHIVRLSP